MSKYTLSINIEADKLGDLRALLNGDHNLAARRRTSERPQDSRRRPQSRATRRAISLAMKKAWVRRKAEGEGNGQRRAHGVRTANGTRYRFRRPEEKQECYLDALNEKERQVLHALYVAKDPLKASDLADQLGVDDRQKVYATLNTLTNQKLKRFRLDRDAMFLRIKAGHANNVRYSLTNQAKRFLRPHYEQAAGADVATA